MGRFSGKFCPVLHIHQYQNNPPTVRNTLPGVKQKGYVNNQQ